ncbi:collagen-like protein [Aggregatimonas sangjinii]|uniref:Collagen-like protein n=1 Tax=Aggregatimonas sangjinii TaxID=2583587 RepID=A0A5B7SWT1_9FLAO|nr:collagen-like protein [Aggregatimonas sangjinii]QCX01789.1 collagen-like protein [Aggregatimonas sangjinii]
MKTYAIFKIVGLSLITCFALACEKDGVEGPVGPQGPQGEQGVAGPQGEPGEDGEDGEPGAANVTYSDWIPSGFAENIESGTATFAIDAPLLTDEIRNDGIILMYARNDESNTIYGIPITLGVFQESYFFRTPQAGELVLRIHSLDGSNIGSTFFDVYRYVLIPRGTTTGKSAVAEDYSEMSYDEIAERFQIPE